MPSFGANPNVVCYLDSIYVYLRARSHGKLDRGRPVKHAGKTEAGKAETDCMGFDGHEDNLSVRCEHTLRYLSFWRRA